MLDKQPPIPGLETPSPFSKGGHKPSTHRKDRIQDLEGRVTLLEAETALLVTQLEYRDSDHA